MRKLVRLGTAAAALVFAAPAVLRSIVMCFLLLASPAAIGAILSLDFETPATGSDLLTSPLSTPFGTVTVVNAASIEPLPVPSNPTQWLVSDQSTNPGFTEIQFDFDVSSITFDYTGFGGGSFLAEILNASGNIIDFLFDPNTDADPPESITATLTGPGIRVFRFQDAVTVPNDTSDVAAVDNLIITVPDVVGIPEPATLALLSLSLAGLAFSRRKKSASQSWSSPPA